MKKWIISMVLLLVVLTGFSIFIYIEARKPMENAKMLAIQKAREAASLQTTEKFYLYHGSETYFVIIGDDKKKEKKVVWIPEKADEEMIVKSYDKGISEEQARKKLQTEKKPKEILGIHLGMEKNIPIWEISYLDKNDRLNYYYIDFATGDWWRKIENL